MIFQQMLSKNLTKPANTDPLNEGKWIRHMFIQVTKRKVQTRQIIIHSNQ
jgi:hypothetical protein